MAWHSLILTPELWNTRPIEDKQSEQIARYQDGWYNGERDKRITSILAENQRLMAGIKSAIEETYDDGVRDLLGDILQNGEDCKDRKRYDKDAYEGLIAVLKSKESENQRLKEALDMLVKWIRKPTSPLPLETILTNAEDLLAAQPQKESE